MAAKNLERTKVNSPIFQPSKYDSYAHLRHNMCYSDNYRGSKCQPPLNDTYLIAQPQTPGLAEPTAFRLKTEAGGQSRIYSPSIQPFAVQEHKALVRVPERGNTERILKKPEPEEWESMTTSMNAVQERMRFVNLKYIPRTIGKIMDNSYVYNRNTPEFCGWRPSNQYGGWTVFESDRDPYCTTTTEEFQNPWLLVKILDPANVMTIAKPLPPWARSTGFGRYKPSRDFYPLRLTPAEFLKYRHRIPMDFIEFTQGNVYKSTQQREMLHPKNFLNVYRVTSKEILE